jgi:tRNA(Ile)-lysidine synthase
MAGEDVREAVRRGGLLMQDRPVLAMLSGGRDSVCLLDVAVALRTPAHVSALHVNYGLREQADADERHCVALCDRLGVALEVVRERRPAPGAAPASGADPTPGADPAPGAGPASGAGLTAPAAAAGASASPPAPGNLQAWAREVRYREADRVARGNDALVATGHTASDQVETILYRLAASPGRRALLGMVASEGRLVRPLLGVTREQTTAYCEARGLAWREDCSNEDQRYARTRVRQNLLEALRAVHPAAEANVLRTAELLRAETQLLDALVREELAGASSIAIEQLERLPVALARMVVVRLAEEAAGTYVPQAGGRVQELIELGRRRGRSELHVGGQAGAVIEDGVLEMVKLPPRTKAR